MALLDNPKFFPGEVTFFFFGLSHRYSLTTNADLSTIEDPLKGTDAILAHICEDLQPA
jgi:hypothetical protein